VSPSGLGTYFALQDRDRVAYQPGEASINHVRILVTEAGYADPGTHEVNGAYISLGAMSGCTVAEVAEAVIARREPAGGQGTLW
jgi:hypothetical protein